jgi:outer membrane lipoprotein SlyB
LQLQLHGFVPEWNTAVYLLETFMDSHCKTTVTGGLLSAAAFMLLMALGYLPGQAQASDFGAHDVPQQSARSVGSVRAGRVVQVQPATIKVPVKSEDRAAAAAIGGLVAAGLTRNANTYTRGAAAAFGAWGGDSLAQRMTADRPAIELIVQIEGGSLVAITQEIDGTSLGAGDAVYVVGHGPMTRVLPVMVPARSSPQPSHLKDYVAPER